jgi:alkaline phosphatase D
MSALAKQNLDFLVHLGDYIYEAAGDSYQTEKVEGLDAKNPQPNRKAQ